VLVTIAEMAMAGGVGATIHLIADAGHLFGEDQARYIVVSADADKVADKAAAAGVAIARIGTTDGTDLTLGHDSVAVSVLKSANEHWLPAYMAGAD
jgi:phosphoribosylformylglycinamidine synthase